MSGLIAFREIVLKVHSRCDLACDHCYVYEHADQSWRNRPKSISDEVLERTADRLAAHARDHALPSVTVILHGGEPLLAGVERLRRACEEFTRALRGTAALDLRLHTNGLRLSPRFLDLFAEYDVRVGISLDGDRAANDRHRRFADGRTSHPLVLKAVALLREDRYRRLYQGLLCTVDVRNDPVAVLDALIALEPPRVDLLLPHATWETPPERPDGTPDGYARWLLRAHDHWRRRGRPVPVRLFDSLDSTLAGGPSLTESLGLAPTDLIVVETDGSLEQADSLKSAYDGAPATGFDVFRHSFDEVAAHPGIRARQLGLAAVAPTCRACPVVRSCGGGLYTHRYRADNGFANPSVYCADLKELVDGVAGRTAAEATAPQLTDPAALTASHHELTRILLARLHEELAGRGGPAWQRAWELLGAIETDGHGPAALDPVLAHPYTRTWLLAALDALRAGRPAGPRAARRLTALAAAAVVRGRLPHPAPLPPSPGPVHLPTLGTLRTGSGDAELRAVGEGFTTGSGTGRRHLRPGRPAPGWQPLRTWTGPGPEGPRVLLDDLDPDRHCFPRPARLRLGRTEAAAWQDRLTAAWSLLSATLPEQARHTAAWLTTLTPLADGPAAPGPAAPRRHGPGALGLPRDAPPEDTAPALLTGVRRARLRALTEVTDLYALDGEWLHPSPWREGRPVPVSVLLADVHAETAAEAWRRARGATDAGAAGGAGVADLQRSLDRLSGCAELTLTGKALVTDLRWELKTAGI
ncbi:radical SAM/SPASM protein FxsB, inactivated metallohydrolase extension form [Streptomyces sp. NPDC097619]|uniref:radical SAM/SPASM protein FxsBH, inactivated beta-hydroxylase extension form n=1 Tax=Streptomyces sp. NPDC097619 TaxID=3157228 RepID=UPI00332FD202